jgi:hypothetical protein
MVVLLAEATMGAIAGLCAAEVAPRLPATALGLMVGQPVVPTMGAPAGQLAVAMDHLQHLLQCHLQAQ